MRETTRVHLLMIEVNALLDKGDFLDPALVHEAIQQERLLHLLFDTFPTDLSLFTEGEDAEALHELLGRVENAIDAERKFGVSRNGLSLIMAFCICALQTIHDEAV